MVKGVSIGVKGHSYCFTFFYSVFCIHRRNLPVFLNEIAALPSSTHATFRDRQVEIISYLVSTLAIKKCGLVSVFYCGLHNNFKG